MINRFLARAVVASLPALVGMSVGCGDNSPSGPMRPTTPTQAAPAPGMPLSLQAISPRTGKTAGATPLIVSGTGFQSGATITLGGVAATITALTSTTITATTPGHEAGTVDVVVMNPDGRSNTLTRGYTYAVFPAGPPPTITAISPNLGITGGGTYLWVTGTGFNSGTIVTVDGVLMPGNAVEGSISFQTVAHPAGRVNVVVTNPSGESATLIGGYTYALPESLNVDGDWQGNAGEHWEMTIRFTIENKVLTSVSCGTTSNVAFSAPPSTSRGEFSVAENGIVVMAGKFFSEDYALGEINLKPCGNVRWEVWKR